MSTWFTKKQTPMRESRSLQLLFNSRSLYDVLSTYVLNRIHQAGYHNLSLASLQFLGALDCGENHASEIARQLGVSRQMVAKTVKELCQMGFLDQHAGTGKQKIIVYTQEGELLIAFIRQVLSDLDDLVLKNGNFNDFQCVTRLFSDLQQAVVLASKQQA